MKEPAKRKVLVIIDEKGGRSPRPVGPEPLTARSAGEKSAPAAPRAPVPRAPASGGKPPISMAE